MADAISLKDRLAARRTELQTSEPIDLPVPGFEDIIVARYHPLSFSQAYRIEARHETMKDKGQAVLFTVCDKLINACDGLYGVQEDGSLEPLEHRWDADAARELFGLELPEGTTAREALLAIFASDRLQMALLEHARAYVEASSELESRIEHDLQGE